MAFDERMMLTQTPNRSVFTQAALKRWDELDSATQAALLGNVWCGTCSKAVHIFVQSGRIENKDLILTGRCAHCGDDVARLVEGE